jgi:dethiobiotin synthetase
MIRLGVTGTDTGVGKTVIASALVGLLRDRGLRVAAMKPVETGVVSGLPTDAVRLAAAAGGIDPLGDVCPATYDEPLAPLVAGQRARRPVDLTALDAAFARLTAERDAIVVEGAGGLRVPLTPELSFAELFMRWRLGVIIVAANRLGAINHVMLTVHAARAAGLRIAGVVVNTTTEAAPDLAAATNAGALAQLLPKTPVLAWPWLPDVTNGTLVAYATRLGLGSLIDGVAAAAAHLNTTERTT